MFLLLTVAFGGEIMATSPEYVEYLKKVATWKVTEYEDNIFKGWTVSETQTLLGDIKPDHTTKAILVPTKKNLPSSINWVNNNCIHSIMDQGNCGSCWAIAAAGVVSDKCCIELGSKDFGWLSPQELLACNTDNDSNHGCAGGSAYEAFQYTWNKGLVDINCLPYLATNSPCDKKCKNNKHWGAAHVCKCKEIIDCSGYDRLKSCLVDGPVAARMIIYKDFLNYGGGVYCRTRDAERIGDHTVRCIGYEEKDTDRNIYCANSWSKYWGDKGYFRIRPSYDCGFYDGEGNIFTMRHCSD